MPALLAKGFDTVEHVFFIKNLHRIGWLQDFTGLKFLCEWPKRIIFVAMLQNHSVKYAIVKDVLMGILEVENFLKN